MNENLTKVGRIACVKMENILDSIALLVKEVTLQLPLYNGKTETPFIFHSWFLLKFMEDFNPETAALDFKNAG